MAERTLRGARLGGQSFEDERGIEFAARQQVGYRCPQGHEFEITMSVEADIPAVWECPRCGAEALSTAGIEPEAKAEKPARTHWDMLLERRSEKELEDILKERLELLRGGEIGPAHLHRANRKKRVVLIALSSRPTSAQSTTSPWTTGPSGPGPGRLPFPGRADPGRRAPNAGATSSRRSTTAVSSRRATRPGERQDQQDPDDVGDEARASASACRRPGSARRRRARGPASGRCCSASRSACHARPPSRRISQAPRMLSSDEQQDRPPGPITWPTWRIARSRPAARRRRRRPAPSRTQPRRRSADAVGGRIGHAGAAGAPARDARAGPSG